MTVERDLIEELSDCFVAAALDRLLSEQPDGEPDEPEEEPEGASQ